jgi:hypothetical protein
MYIFLKDVIILSFRIMNDNLRTIYTIFFSLGWTFVVFCKNNCRGAFLKDAYLVEAMGKVMSVNSSYVKSVVQHFNIHSTQLSS